jgi:hypothetical protein
MRVVTAHFGDQDPLLEPLVVEPGVDYLCYTDRDDLQSDAWEMVRFSPGDGDRELARQVKMNCLSGHGRTVWIDGTYQMKRAPSSLFKALEGYDLLAMAHPHRQDIIEEGEAIVKGHGIQKELVDAQLEAYKTSGFPLRGPLNGLTTTGLLVSSGRPDLARFTDLWAVQLMCWGHLRDQMSVDYCIWRSGIKAGYLYGHYRNNPYVRYWRHGGTLSPLQNIDKCRRPGRRFVNA